MLIQEGYIPGELIYYARKLPGKLKQVRIVPLSDPHYGSPLFSLQHWRETLAFIADNEDVYAICNGDLCESSLRTSKGDIYQQVGSPQDQRDWMIHQLMPIKHKILGMTTGNHEYRIYNETGIDISKDIAERLKVPYRSEGIMLKVSFGRGNSGHKTKPYVYFVYATHGYGGARTKSAKAVKVERLATWLHASVYIMSHDHVVNVAPDVYLVPDNRTHQDKDTGFQVGKIKAHRKMLVKSNAYLKWGGYSERGGFPPVDLETPIIQLSGEGKPRVRVTV